jgi:hypothetical protein
MRWDATSTPLAGQMTPVDLRDVVVLGWWAAIQNRLEFVNLLVRELRVGHSAARMMLETQLAQGSPIVIPVAPAARAARLAADIVDLGAEVRLLSGHRGTSAAARAELERIQRALADFHARRFVDRIEREETAHGLCAELA